MTPHLRNLGLATLVCAGGLVGQAPAPAAVIPAGPLMTMHIDGPAALRGAFLPTNVGKMFAGPEFKDMLAPFMQMYEGMKAQGADKLPFDPNAFEKALLSYAGRLSASFHLLDEKVDFNSRKFPAFALTIVLTPDGKTDLAEMCKKAEEIAKTTGDDLASAVIGDTTLRYVDANGDPAPCLPFMHKGHAVMIIAPDMERAGKAVLNAQAMHKAPEAHASAAVGIWVDVKRVVSLIKPGLAQQAGPMWDAMGAKLFGRSGLESVDSLEATYRAQGPAVLSEMAFQFNSADRGLFGLFCSPQATKSPLVDVLPRNAASAGAMPFDLKKVFDIVKATFADLGDAAPMTFDDFLDQFKENVGLRLKEDILDAFGNGLLTAQMPAEAGGVMSPLGTVDGMCLGFDMADGAKFGKSLDTLLAANGMQEAVQKAEYKGRAIYTLSMGMIEAKYAISDKLFLLGIGSKSGDAIRSILDEATNRAEGKAPTPLPKPVQDRLKMYRGSFMGLGWSDLENVFTGLLTQLDMVAGQLPPELGGVLDVVEKIPPLFKNYKVQHQVTVTQSSANRWAYVNIW